MLALAGCGPDEIASPGTGGNVIINNPAPTPTPSPTPSSAQVSPANGCPTINDAQGLTDEGTITGPEGTWRVCATPLRFNASSTLPYVEGLLYRLPGQVTVGTDGGPAADASDGLSDTNVELTIEPGVIIFASGSSYLNVARGNSIDANGTADRPIVFTSRDNVLGLNNDASSGQWGGVVLSGRARVTDCRTPGATPGTVNCERQVEGAASPAFYGGATDNDSSGSMSYVQIRYSGFVLGGDNELQALSPSGVGSGTDLSYIQSHNSSDDGIEWFGGITANDHLIVTGAEDDSLDWDYGARLDLQFVYAAQRSGVGDTMIESDSDNGLYTQTPRTDVRLANATLIQRKNDDQVVRIRGASDVALYNSLIVDASAAGTPCIRIDQSETVAASGANGGDEDGPPVFQSVALDCGTDFRSGSDGGPTAAQAEALFNSYTGNNASYTNTLVNGYLNGSGEDGFAPIFDVTRLGSNFTSVNFIGAVSSANDWTRGWTCNSSAATFPSNTGACTSLPVYD